MYDCTLVQNPNEHIASVNGISSSLGSHVFYS